MMIEGSASQQDRGWAAAAHLIAMLAGYLVPVVGNIAGPLVIYAMNKDRSRFVSFHALQAAFWAILWMLVFVACGLLALTIILIPLLMIVAPVLALVGLIYSIVGAVKAYNGELWEYPIVGATARDQVGL